MQCAIRDQGPRHELHLEDPPVQGGPGQGQHDQGEPQAEDEANPDRALPIRRVRAPQLPERAGPLDRKVQRMLDGKHEIGAQRVAALGASERLVRVLESRARAVNGEQQVEAGDVARLDRAAGDPRSVRQPDRGEPRGERRGQPAASEVQG